MCSDLMWKRLLPLLHKWDRAFAVLDEELEALYEHMQFFMISTWLPWKFATFSSVHDQCVSS